MAVQIGQKAANFSEPLELLSDCHRRIERFLSILAKVAADVHGGEMNEEQRVAFTGALQYFRDAAPKHTADEERSLFPRLRATGHPEVEDAIHDIERLEADHFRADRWHREVDEIGAAWLRNGRIPGESAERLSLLTNKLCALYSAHIEIEDKRLFPMAAKVLQPSDQEAIGKEMAARRQITVHTIL